MSVLGAILLGAIAAKHSIDAISTVDVFDPLVRRPSHQTTDGWAKSESNRDLQRVESSTQNALARYHLHRVEDVPSKGETCTPSSLWNKEFDIATYEIGCDEVEVGHRTHTGSMCFKEVV